MDKLNRNDIPVFCGVVRGYYLVERLAQAVPELVATIDAQFEVKHFSFLLY
ncbi:MAG: hypothetical protein ACU0B7_00940 [Paracoccaceae bacterium]